MERTGIFNCVCCSRDFTLTYDATDDVNPDRVSCARCIAKQAKICEDRKEEQNGKRNK